MMNIKRKLKSIRALAESGATEGERAAAMDILQKFCRQHDIDLDAVTDDTEQIYWFRWKTQLERQLLFGCQARVMMAVAGTDLYYHTRQGTRKEIGFMLTAVQAADMEVFYEHYKTDLNKQVNLFVEAYLMKNDLCYQPDDSTIRPPRPDINLLKSFYMAIHSTDPHKQLGGGCETQ